MRLSSRELRAIEEALNSRLAGEIEGEDEPGAPKRADYESAWGKVLKRLSEIDGKARPD